jgi:hypothetical protein
MSEALKLSGDEIEMLTRKRLDAGLDLTGFPNDEEVQRVLDLRIIADAKAAKKRGGQDGRFNLDQIKLGMSKADRDRAMQEILKNWQTS